MTRECETFKKESEAKGVLSEFGSRERGKRSRKLHNEWGEEQTKLYGWGGGEKVSVIISILFSPEGGTNRGNHRHQRTSSKAIHSAMWYSNYPTRRSDDCFANWLSLQWGWLTGRLIVHPTYSFGGILGFILPCPHRAIFPIDYFGYLNGFWWFRKRVNYSWWSPRLVTGNEKPSSFGKKIKCSASSYSHAFSLRRWQWIGFTNQTRELLRTF